MFEIDYYNNRTILGYSKDYLNQLTRGSETKIYFKCSQCGKTTKKPIRCADLVKHGKLRSCEFCSSNKSYPERFVTSLLEELQIEYEKEKVFLWGENFKYDFYIPKLNCIIETHGEQHYNENTNWGRTLSEQQSIDLCKKETALNNGILHYVELDCRKSEMTYIRQSIYKSELKNIVNLKSVIWEKIGLKCEESEVIKVCNYWNELNDDDKDTKKVAEVFNTNDTQIRRYLKRGNEIGICKYDVSILNSNRAKKISESNKLPYKCILNGEERIFYGMESIMNYFNIEKHIITRLLKTGRPYRIFHKNTNKNKYEHIEGLIIRKMETSDN